MADDQTDARPPAVGDTVTLQSGGPNMTVSHTFFDTRYEPHRQYAKVVYFNPVTGDLERQSIAVALLRLDQVDD